MAAESVTVNVLHPEVVPEGFEAALGTLLDADVAVRSGGDDLVSWRAVVRGSSLADSVLAACERLGVLAVAA